MIISPTPQEKRLGKLLRIISIFAIAFCSILLFPQMRNYIIYIGEKAIWPTPINHDLWVERLLYFLLAVILCFICVLLSTIRNVQTFLDMHIKSRENIFIFFSIVIIMMSIIVRIVMYVKSRSLWGDEAMLAENFVTRNWFELLVPPLSNGQSVPVLYAISVKLFGLIFGYSEFSLRFFSLLSFIGLLVCETIFLKRALGYGNFQIAFVVAVTSLLPAYIWYSNELKPYMSDAFFVVLIVLLYFYYIQNKMKLSTLTVLYILILGFSTPAIFFIAGILLFEFFSAIYNKNKKLIIHVLISGLIVLVVFGLYYYWWLSPIQTIMESVWGDYNKQYNMLTRILLIFSPRIGYSNSLFIILFIPFSILGFLTMCKSKNKIAYSIILSLLFAILASAMGYWPMAGRLWLFLPVIILVFTPVGIDFVHIKINREKISKAMEFFFFTAILFSLAINCLGYIGYKTYFPKHELNPLIEYVQRNIKDDEELYVYPAAKFAFGFRNGYTVTKIGNVNNNNIIFGRNQSEWGENSLGSDLSTILEYKKVYLISYWYEVDNDLKLLRDYGTITEVLNINDTPLYYFERRENN